MKELKESLYRPFMICNWLLSLGICKFIAECMYSGTSHSTDCALLTGVTAAGLAMLVFLTLRGVISALKKQ